MFFQRSKLQQGFSLCKTPYVDVSVGTDVDVDDLHLQQSTTK